MRLLTRAPGALALALTVSGCTGGGSSSSHALSAAIAPATTSATAPVTTGVAVPVSTGPARTAPANLVTGPRLVLDANGGAFFDRPWPSDARLKPNGGPDYTGIPNPRSKDWIQKIADLAESDTRGASPTGAIYFRFDAPINAPANDPVASVLPSSPILLVDIDPRSPEKLGRRRFYASLTTTGDTVRPANLLQLLPVPGLGLRPSTTYAAIVLRRLGAPGAPFLGQPPALTDLLAGRTPAGAQGTVLARAYAPLVVALKDLNLHPDDLAAATVFTTGDPTGSLVKQVAHVDGLPPLAPRSLAVRNDYPGFTVLKGTWPSPVYQAGAAPFLLGGGRQVVDANGLPLEQYSEDAEFQVCIPKGKMPAAGFPLYFYVHGTGGSAKEPADRGRNPTAKTDPPKGSGPASYLAPRGVAMSCTDGWLSPGRIGLLSADGYASYNFMNAVAMRDNFVQMVLEQVNFRRLLLSLRIDPTLCPGTDASASPDGKIGFDATKVIVGGQSLGSYLSGMLAATAPGWQGAVLTGAGGSWVEFAFGPKVPVDLQTWIEALALSPGERLDRFHPLIMAFDAAVGRADNTHYLRYVLREPLPGHVPPHVLVIEGHVDKQVPTGLQRALTLALGIDLGGTDVGATIDERLAPILTLSGRHVLPFPIRDNVTLASGGTRTGVVCRYDEDGIKEGHYVAFQLDDPKKKIGEFVEALVQGRAPEVR